MKLIKKLLIPGVALSVLFGFSFAEICNITDGVYHNSELGLISVVENGSTIYTIQDKNVGATCINPNSSCSYGSQGSYQNNCPNGYSIISENFVDKFIPYGWSFFQSYFYFPDVTILLYGSPQNGIVGYWLNLGQNYLYKNSSSLRKTNSAIGSASLPYRCQKNQVLVPDSSFVQTYGTGFFCKSEQEFAQDEITSGITNGTFGNDLNKGLSSVVKFALQFLPLMIFVFILGYIIRKILIRFGMLKSPGVALNSKTYNKGKN